MVRKTVAQLVEQPCRQVAGSSPAGQAIQAIIGSQRDTDLDPRPALPAATAQGVVSLEAGVREESRQARLA